MPCATRCCRWSRWWDWTSAHSWAASWWWSPSLAGPASDSWHGRPSRSWTFRSSWAWWWSRPWPSPPATCWRIWRTRCWIRRFAMGKVGPRGSAQPYSPLPGGRGTKGEGSVEIQKHTGGAHMRQRWIGLAALVGLALLASLVAPTWGQNRGDSMIVTFKDDISTLDPAIGYDWQNWSIIKSIFDGLMDYEPGTTKLVPHQAESFTVSADGKSYTFKLRRGVKFHNGREVTAADVKYSLERTLNPKTQSPGAGFFGDIAGTKEFADGKAKEVSGIKTADKYTIAFTLSKPNAAFLHILALNFAHVVPKEEVEKTGADFGHKPVGTGAFKVKEWVLGQRLVLARNPDYFVKGRPYLEEIVFQVGVEPNVAFLKLQRGEVDILGDGIPPAEFTKVMNDAKLRALVAVGDQLQTGYVTINTQVKPFTDVRVRRAGGMAWIADYPDPNDCYWPILSCASLSPGTWNWAWYCNQRVEKMVEEADALVQASQAAAREAKYREIYRAVMQDAPWIPIFHEKRYTMHTVRIGGSPLLFNDPIHIPVHYTEVRVVQ